MDDEIVLDEQEQKRTLRKILASYEGYSGKMYRYDLLNNKWEKLPVRFRNRAYHTVFHYGGRLYVAGGKRLSTNRQLQYLDHTMEIYDIERDTVILDPVNPHQAIHFASCVFNDHLILLGGSVKEKHSGKKEYTSQVHALDLKKGFWYEMPSLPEAREMRGVCIEDQVYLISNLHQQASYTSISRYSLTEGTLEQVTQLDFDMKRPAMAEVGDLIYLFEKDIIQTYNVKTGEKRAYKIALQLYNSEMFCYSGKLYLLGGQQGDGDFHREPMRGFYCIDLQDFENTRLYAQSRTN
ncbi:MAG: hypothetical protein LUF04_02345 [Bacteroides sp.]|nr:hypothetical protein [Bacteroides sp.]